MDEQVKREWLEALRSGRYRKTTGVLHRNGNRYCALGVLCAIAVKHGVVPCVPDGADDLPSRVNDWAELSYNDESLVACMNDNGMSFNKIAKWIEDNL
jgi:hypothetical protein